MLVKIFGLPSAAQTKVLLGEALAELRKSDASLQVRIGFSPIRIHKESEPGPIRVLVTGLDAHGREREVTRIVGHACMAYCKRLKIEWRGFEDSPYPGQPGESQGRAP